MKATVLSNWSIPVQIVRKDVTLLGFRASRHRHRRCRRSSYTIIAHWHVRTLFSLRFCNCFKCADQVSVICVLFYHLRDLQLWALGLCLHKWFYPDRAWLSIIDGTCRSQANVCLRADELRGLHQATVLYCEQFVASQDCQCLCTRCSWTAPHNRFVYFGIGGNMEIIVYDLRT